MLRAARAPVKVFNWSSDSGPLDAILDHPATGHATAAALAAEGGRGPRHRAHPGTVCFDARVEVQAGASR